MKRLGRRRAKLLAAVAGIFATGSTVSAASVYIQSNLVDPGSAPHFVALVDADLHRPPMVTFTWGSNLPKGSAKDSFDLQITDPFTDFAVFGRDSAGGIFVTFSNGSASIGQSFENLFPGVSETQLATDLLVAPDSKLVTGFAALLAQTPGAITPMDGTTAQVTHFSSGVDYGTFRASFTPLPEPGSCVVIAAAGGLLFRRRRINC